MELMYRNVDDALPALAFRLNNYGKNIHSRGGLTKELFGVAITLTHPLEREVLLSERRASLPAQIAETMWVLAGRDDIRWLEMYLPRAAEFSDDGEKWRAAYGARLRHWQAAQYSNGKGADQLAEVVTLLKADPHTRRAVMSIFDPGADMVASKDIPCNNWLHFMFRDGALHLHVATRSNDMMWGWSGINQFEWSTLLEVVAGLVGMNVGSIRYSVTSFHAYERHFEKIHQMADVIAPPPSAGESPRFKAPRDVADFDKLVQLWFDAEALIRAGSAEAFEVCQRYPEPMFRSWLQVIAWWHHDDPRLLDGLEGTRLYRALMQSPKGARPKITPEPAQAPTSFVTYVADLHAKKHAAYGDSWKKRGEQLSVLANIARKIDRLGKTDDLETAADTAIDLLVYLAKYRWFITDAGEVRPVGGANDEDEVARVTALIALLGRQKIVPNPLEDPVKLLTQFFDELCATVDRGASRKWLVDTMLKHAYSYAAKEWWKANNEKRTWKGYGE